MVPKKEHEWNVLIVEKRDFPRPPSKEFQIKSTTLLGAAMKAKNIIKNDYEGWMLHNIWWLDPKRVRR